MGLGGRLQLPQPPEKRQQSRAGLEARCSPSAHRAYSVFSVRLEETKHMLLQMHHLTVAEGFEKLQ